MSGCLSFLAKIGWYLIWTIIVSFIYVNGLNENDEFIWFDNVVKNIIASVIFFGPPVIALLETGSPRHRHSSLGNPLYA